MDILILSVVIVLLVLLVLLWVVIARTVRRRAEAWEGTVVDKTRASLDDRNMYHYIKVRIIDGNRKKVRVSEKLWKSFDAGDGAIKRPGKYNPRKR